jgi:hypothetical protein
MRSTGFVHTGVLLVLAVVWGCGPAPTETAHEHSDGTHAAAGHAGHDHDHGDHDHESLGPHEGHVLELGEEQYHAEWLHDDETGKVTVILLDSEIEEEVGTTAESVTISVAIGQSDQRQYVLPAVNRSDEDPPKASRFELVEPALITALQIGEGVEAVLQVEIDGQTFSATIEHEAHGHEH